MRPFAALALVLALAVPAARAEIVEIPTQPRHFTTDATLSHWYYVRDSFEPHRFSIILSVQVDGIGKLEWEYALPEEATKLTADGVLTWTDPQGRTFALAADSPFAPPGNLLDKVDGVALVNHQGWWFHVGLQIDTEVNPPVAGAREARARARFVQLRGRS